MTADRPHRPHITIPAPVMAFPADLPTSEWCRAAADRIEHGDLPGSNVRAMISRILRDAADALDAEETTPPADLDRLVRAVGPAQIEHTPDPSVDHDPEAWSLHWWEETAGQRARVIVSAATFVDVVRDALAVVDADQGVTSRG